MNLNQSKENADSESQERLSGAYRDLTDEQLMRAHADIGDELSRRYRDAKRRQAAGQKGYTLGGSPEGTSLQGYMAASFAQLDAILGPPNERGDEYKVSTEWTLTLTDGRVVTIYDYKNTKLYDDDLPSVAEFRALPEYQWHIGGKGGGPALAAHVQKLLFSSDTGASR